MTEGRYETVHNLRPPNWDHRRLWTNWHHQYDCDDVHLKSESCPFHDLRTGGQFQDTDFGGSPFAPPISPEDLNNRPDGDRMDFALYRMGEIAPDTEPNGGLKPNKIDRFASIHTKKDPLMRGLFSEPKHMPEGESDEKGRETDDDGINAKRRCGYMRAGGNHAYIGQPAEYIPEVCREQEKPRRYRVSTGPIKHDFPPWMPEGERKRRKKKTYGFFLAGKPNSFNIGGEYEWIPDPYEVPKIRNDKRPFKTWHTSTKWSMPTYAPWSTGLSTAEPRKGAQLDLTTSGIPNLSKHPQVRLSQTIGPIAALAPIGGRKR